VLLPSVSKLWLLLLLPCCRLSLLLAALLLLLAPLLPLLAFPTATCIVVPAASITPANFILAGAGAGAAANPAAADTGLKGTSMQAAQLLPATQQQL
jgi:hypothetical protein